MVNLICNIESNALLNFLTHDPCWRGGLTLKTAVEWFVGTERACP